MADFCTAAYNDTRQQIARRLWGVIQNKALARMFNNPKNKIDLFTETNAGKVILINTAKDYLKTEGSQIFGRFFIAMTTQAALQRARRRAIAWTRTSTSTKRMNMSTIGSRSCSIRRASFASGCTWRTKTSIS